jgi:hypothetical protein
MDGDRSLTYDEWIQIFLTCEDIDLRQNTLMRYAQTLQKFEVLPKEIETAISDVFEKEILL